ncbi:hypothetical protein CAEBREN_06766 [Caenorhabditis brenneri]|uniref:Transposase Tc5 C-terminal domain-containing protein n=1 Tax=Caenorhabditis brenneri TaxID=135651 RepID=G0NT07_CAEBE|nr:hypothetical protein CAEBREN_06766 [Caenorhabditis brenneri]
MFSCDPTLKLISLVWRQLCHPKLRDWARYAWHASGYNCPRPPHFSTPSQLMFPHDVVTRDCDKTGCTFTSFIVCLHCEKHYCFKCFVICYHKC